MSPRSKKQNEVIRQQSMTAIKEAALETFAKYGYHSTKVSQIAKEAGISNGLLYNYFGGKEELLRAIVKDAMDQNDAGWLKVLQSDLPPMEKLTQAVETTFDNIKSNLHYWKLLSALAFQPDVQKSMEDLVMAKKELYINLLIDLFQQMGYPDPEKEVFFFGAILDGIFLHYMNMEDAYPLDMMKDMVLQRYRG
ncbi:MAG: TetR/AcrR family transcriptional regulator [Saprospiraceae bacterium]|nr:TetR/AcrR family transcriptional regulator [Saprospiraceae bacterium]